MTVPLKGPIIILSLPLSHKGEDENKCSKKRSGWFPLSHFLSLAAAKSYPKRSRRKCFTDLLSPAVAVVLVAPLLPAAPLPLPHAPPQPQMMTVVLMVAVVAMVVVGGRAPALLVEGASVSRRRRG